MIVKVFSQIQLHLFVVLVALINGLSVVEAQPIQTKVRFVPPPSPPPNQPVIPSGRRDGGASRGGNCTTTNNNEVLTAVVPTRQMQLQLSEQERPDNPELSKWDLVLGLTSVANPTFLFYVPYDSELPIDFILQNGSGKTLYKSSYTADGKRSRFIRLSVPTTLPLKVGQYYKWYLIVDCGNTASLGVDGWVQRITLAPKLKQQLQQATPQQRVALYAANGIWYDAVSTVAALRLKNPNDLTLLADWTSLLETVGLKAIAREPISNCCTSRGKTAWDNN